MKEIRTCPRFQGPAKYLSDHIHAGSKIGIDCLTRNISTRPGSHRGAWARIIQHWLTLSGYKSKILTDVSELSSIDTLVIDHGMEFDGVFNVFGGASDELAARLRAFVEFGLRDDVKVFSFEVQMPSLSDFVKAREKSASDEFKKLANLDLDGFCKKAVWVDAVTHHPHVCIGDSHILSVWTPGTEIRRHDGKTLYGALKNGLKSYLYGEHDSVTFYFGNIDIRHHLARQPDPISATLNLAAEYVKQIDEIARDRRVEVIGLLPVENESRKLPQSGFYNGKPFHGSQAQRAELVKMFNVEVKSRLPTGCSFYWWPESFKNELGELKFDVMEKPKSIHISPEFYRYTLP